MVADNHIQLYSKMNHSLLLVLLCFLSLNTFCQTSYLLYEKQPIPNSIEGPDEEISEIGEDGVLRISKVSIPTLTAYLPKKGQTTGQAVIICPGGGYHILAAGHEGSDVAQAFVENGIAAFVLKYRLPSDEKMQDKTIGPLQDTQRAIQMVRENAGDWGIKPDQVGILGFSAGGHLAATAGTQYENELILNPEKTSLKPDFIVLVYPVTSFDPEIGHSGSARNLLGQNPPKELLDKFSNEKHVNAKTPPTFLVHAKDDGVSIQNSYVFEKALNQHSVSVQTLYYESGGHGFGLLNAASEIKWMDKVVEWLQK